jgi:hypothetical protein
MGRAEPAGHETAVRARWLSLLETPIQEVQTMSARSSRPSWINGTPPNSRENERRRERWKASPSTEVTSEQGENARTARERKVEENAPRARGGKAARARGGKTARARGGKTARQR